MAEEEKLSITLQLLGDSRDARAAVQRLSAEIKDFRTEASAAGQVRKELEKSTPSLRPMLPREQSKYENEMARSTINRTKLSLELLDISQKLTTVEERRARMGLRGDTTEVKKLRERVTQKREQMAIEGESYKKIAEQYFERMQQARPGLAPKDATPEGKAKYEAASKQEQDALIQLDIAEKERRSERKKISLNADSIKIEKQKNSERKESQRESNRIAREEKQNITQKEREQTKADEKAAKAQVAEEKRIAKMSLIEKVTYNLLQSDSKFERQIGKSIITAQNYAKALAPVGVVVGGVAGGMVAGYVAAKKLQTFLDGTIWRWEQFSYSAGQSYENVQQTNLAMRKMGVDSKNTLGELTSLNLMLAKFEKFGEYPELFTTLQKLGGFDATQLVGKSFQDQIRDINEVWKDYDKSSKAIFAQQLPMLAQVLQTELLVPGSLTKALSDAGLSDTATKEYRDRVIKNRQDWGEVAGEWELLWLDIGEFSVGPASDAINTIADGIALLRDSKDNLDKVLEGDPSGLLPTRRLSGLEKIMDLLKIPNPFDLSDKRTDLEKMAAKPAPHPKYADPALISNINGPSTSSQIINIMHNESFNIDGSMTADELREMLVSREIQEMAEIVGASKP